MHNQPSSKLTLIDATRWRRFLWFLSSCVCISVAAEDPICRPAFSPQKKNSLWQQKRDRAWLARSRGLGAGAWQLNAFPARDDAKCTQKNGATTGWMDMGEWWGRLGDEPASWFSTGKSHLDLAFGVKLNLRYFFPERKVLWIKAVVAFYTLFSFLCCTPLPTYLSCDLVSCQVYNEVWNWDSFFATTTPKCLEFRNENFVCQLFSRIELIWSKVCEQTDTFLTMLDTVTFNWRWIDAGQCQSLMVDASRWWSMPVDVGRCWTLVDIAQFLLMPIYDGTSPSKRLRFL